MSFGLPRASTPTGSRRSSMTAFSPSAKTPARFVNSSTTFVPDFTPRVERSYGRKLAPPSYREPVHTVHSGVVGSNGVPLSRGKGRANSPSVSSHVITPSTPVPGEKPEPLMSVGPTGTWVSRGVRASTPPPTRIQREMGKCHIRSPDTINVFHQTPLIIQPSHPCQVPLPSDIPGLTNVPPERIGAGAGSVRPGLRITGPVPFIPPPFLKAPYSPQRRQISSVATMDNDVLLQRRTAVAPETPRRAGLRSVSPSSSTRYNIITNQPF